MTQIYEVIIKAHVTACAVDFLCLCFVTRAVGQPEAIFNPQESVHFSQQIPSLNWEKKRDSENTLWNLIVSFYKDGTRVLDTEIVCILIGLLMAGKYLSFVTSSWILFQFAAQAENMEELYYKQLCSLGDDTLTHESAQSIPLTMHVTRENSSPSSNSLFHAKSEALAAECRHWAVSRSHVLLAARTTMGKSDDYFPILKDGISVGGKVEWILKTRRKKRWITYTAFCQREPTACICPLTSADIGV